MLEIRLLGQFDLQQEDVSIEISSRPAKTLLAYLLLTRGTHHPRERLAGLLWPESKESNVRKNLRQALWHLRKSIGESYLMVDTVSIAFSSSAAYWLDIAILENPAEQNMETVVSLYEGELLPGYYEDWVLLERDRLSAVFERKISTLVDRASAGSALDRCAYLGGAVDCSGPDSCSRLSRPDGDLRRHWRIIKGGGDLSKMR